MSKLQRYRLVEDRPSRLARALSTLRSYTLGPLTLKDPEIARRFNTTRVSSGVTVTEETALHYSAFFGAVNLISSQVATLPLILYKRGQDGGKTRFNTSHPLYRLLHDRPNPEMSSFDWRKAMQAHALTWGNGYSEIERDQAGRPVALWPLMPGRVRPFRLTPTSDLQYIVSNEGGGQVTINRADMVHIHGLSLDGNHGLNMVHHMAGSLGLGIAAQEFGETFFGNGSTFGGVISYEQTPNEQVRKENRDALAARHQGVQNAHQMLAIYGGGKYEQLGVPPNLAQFLETRQFQVTEVARWFNIPPHKIGDLSRSTNNNIEQQDIDFYKTTMLPWLTSWEQELWYKLVPPLEQNIQIVEFLVEGLLRGDVTARGEFYVKQSQAGAITPNEIRSAENRNTIKGGDISLVPLAMIPLHQIEAYYEAEIEAKKAPKVAPVPPDPTQAKRIETLEQEIGLARKRAQEAEDAKDHANALLTERAVELLAEQAAHGGTRTTGEATIARMADVEAGLRSDVDKLTRQIAEFATRAELADAEHSRVLAENRELAEVRDDYVVRATKLDDERISLQERTESLSLDVVAAQADTTRANERTVQADNRTAVTEAVVTELRIQVGTLMADVETRQSAISEAREALVRAETERDEQKAMRTAADAAMEAALAQVQASHQTMTAVREALRGAMSYSVGCIIRREADRARRAQASPDKLLKWIEHFYPLHGEFCRETLRPIVRALAACDGTDADAILPKIVAELIEESTLQLRAVADETNEDTLAPALERVLRRWEAERGQAVADRLMRGDV